MPRRVDPDAPRVVLRTARVGLRLTPAQRERCFRLLASAGDVWACALDMNRWRRRRGLPTVVSYQALCRELSAAGPGTFGELDTIGARSVPRRYSDAWFATAKRRKDGDASVRFPRRKRRLMPVRYYHGTFTLEISGYDFRSVAGARRCRYGWTGRFPTRSSTSGRSPCSTKAADCSSR
ncbi:hypothetical protein [Actinoallomurus sp. NPDC050550]|uniref:hypothetical protein n=1 Tax=Actinoallomurus sp. NPDC050550 TaxID=3154937 RepID=UPI003401AC78